MGVLAIPMPRLAPCPRRPILELPALSRFRCALVLSEARLSVVSQECPNRVVGPTPLRARRIRHANGANRAPESNWLGTRAARRPIQTSSVHLASKTGLL